MDQLSRERKTIDRIDGKMTDWFVKRMKTVERIAEYKKERGIPVYDPEREAARLARCSAMIEEEELKPYLERFLSSLAALSREYQERILGKEPEADMERKSE